MIDATSAKNKVFLEFAGAAQAYRLERKLGPGGAWLVWTAQGFAEAGAAAQVANPFIDVSVGDGIYQYRARDFVDDSGAYDYSAWVRCGEAGPVGYTFGNYAPPEGPWGEVMTADDLRYTYLWGVDFRASNGESFTDEQIRYFIDDALGKIARALNITIKKTRVACEPERRGLRPGVDYDEEESYYTYKRERIQRNGMITTRKRPVISVSRLDLMIRNDKLTSLLSACTLDKTKGMIRFFNRLPKMSDSARAVGNAVFVYGADTWDRNLSYAIDYIAGWPSAAAVPADLREIVGKQAAVSLLNNIGRGLMSGFSSSSLSMDGVSESFSSTQSATSAYYGADIKEYKDDIENYIAANKMKFGHVVLGAL